MYPIDAPQLVRRATLGSHALDPTLPHRPSRRLHGKRALAAVLRAASRDHQGVATTQEAASPGTC